MEAALLWHDSPFEFWARPDMERAIMIAHWREKRLRSGLSDKVHSDVRDKKKGTTTDSSNTYSNFFGGVGGW